MSVEALPEYRRKSRFGLYVKNLKGEWEKIGDGERINQGGRIPPDALNAMTPCRPRLQPLAAKGAVRGFGKSRANRKAKAQ